MQCYACEQEATRRCPRCARPYCAQHGADLCALCLHPASGAPSGTVFRGSLLALLVAGVLALWLLVRPPGLPGESAPVVMPLPTPGPTFRTGPAPIATPVPTTTPTPTLQPTPTQTPTPSPTPPPPFETYNVQEGDTLFGIADRFGVKAEDIAAASGLSGLDAILNIGQELTIPRATPTPTPAPAAAPTAQP